jgi:putative metalloprotease
MTYLKQTKKIALIGITGFLLAGCASDGGFNTNAALALGMGALQVATLDEGSVKQASTLSAQQMDKESKVAGAHTQYDKRLQKLTRDLQVVGKHQFNYKVYLSRDLNAFAMADGTVRVYSGLMDVMPDDQLAAVIYHEIGHVVNKHTYKQMRENVLTNTAYKTLESTGGTIADLTASQLGQIGFAAVNAHFSQSDELESDAFAVNFLKQRKEDPSAMLRAIQTLQKHSGASNSSFLSTHPSNEKRIERIKQML